MVESPLFTAGVARIDVTPPVGFRMQGMMRRVEPSIGIESPLLATALVLADAETKVVVVDCDLFGFDMPLDAQIRQAIGAALQTPSNHVLLGYTHTHNAPCTVRGTNGGVHDVDGDPRERAALDGYVESLQWHLAGVAKMADDARRPAWAAAGHGHAGVAVNREERTADGRIVVGRNPDGPVDHSVDVLRIDDINGKPIAVLAGYAAHPVVMGYHNYLLSPDYPGVVRRIVEQATGGTCLFLTGAAGDQATLSFLQDDWGEVERMGGIVGCEVAKVFFEIEPRPHRVVREMGVSISNIAHYRKEFLEGRPHQHLAAASRQVKVPLQPLPSRAQAEARLAEATAAVQKLRQEGAPVARIYPARLVQRWAEGVLGKVRAGTTQEVLSFEIVGFRLDNFVLVGMPGEPFVEIQLEVKRRSKARHTMFAGYCNGVLAYWPSPQTVDQGGMAVESSVITYNISAPPVRETVGIIVGEFDLLLSELGV